MQRLIDKLRRDYPDCLIAIWASLECTNHSKAKGGLSRDADSRSLADHLFRYLDALNPDFVWIENVTEFMDWGPLRIKEGKKSTDLYCELSWDVKKENYIFIPIKAEMKTYYNQWISTMKSYGYEYDRDVLNAADYGAFQSRKRYFGQFAKPGLPIGFPEATHAKDPKKFKDKKLKKWKAVKRVLHLHDEGSSIFTRKKQLSENTLKRIYAGLVKFVAKGDTTFLNKYYSGDPNQLVKSIYEPASTIRTKDGQSLIRCIPASGDDAFLARYNGGNPDDKVQPLSQPAGTVTTSNRHALVKYVFLSAFYGHGTNTSVDEPCNTLTTKDRFSKISAKFLVDYQFKSNAHSLENPAPTITTKDKFSPVTAQFITSNYSGGGQSNSLDNPSPSVTTVPKHNLTTAINMIDNQYGRSKPQSVDQPSSTVTANPKQALVSIRPWLMNMNTSTGPSKSLDDPSPAVTQRTHRLISADPATPWLMETAYNNVGQDLNNPSPTLTASRRHHYIVNPQWGTSGVRSVEDPSATLIARMDKAPPYLVSSEEGSYGVIVYEDDCETMIKIKWFMAAYGLVDVKMRMLNIPELLAIQGFPSNYKLTGNATQQKKCIGNAVEVTVGKALFRKIDADIQSMSQTNSMVS